MLMAQPMINIHIDRIWYVHAWPFDGGVRGRAVGKTSHHIDGRGGAN